MYQVEFAPGAERDLSRLDASIAQRVLKRLRWLAENFETIRPERLTGQWQGVFKLRVGEYRVLYTCDQAERKIIVHFVRHRREVRGKGHASSTEEAAIACGSRLNEEKERRTAVSSARGRGAARAEWHE